MDSLRGHHRGTVARRTGLSDQQKRRQSLLDGVQLFPARSAAQSGWTNGSPGQADGARWLGQARACRRSLPEGPPLTPQRGGPVRWRRPTATAVPPALASLQLDVNIENDTTPWSGWRGHRPPPGRNRSDDRRSRLLPHPHQPQTQKAAMGARARFRQLRHQRCRKLVGQSRMAQDCRLPTRSARSHTCPRRTQTAQTHLIGAEQRCR